jgi:hypothetical protein
MRIAPQGGSLASTLAWTFKRSPVPPRTGPPLNFRHSDLVLASANCNREAD